MPTTMSLRAGVAIAIDAMVTRIDELEVENARLTRENARLCRQSDEHLDEIYELQQKVVSA